MPGNTTTISRNIRVPTAGLLLVTAVCIVLNEAGFIIDSPSLTVAVSAALLVFGLPHGTFDLALVRKAAGAEFRTRSGIVTIFLYLASAAGMYLLWRIEPLVALAAFLLMAVAHFAEDWEACGSPSLSIGIAAAIVSAPSLLHGDRLGALFALLAGDVRAALLAQALQLVAPVAMLLAVAGLSRIWRTGAWNQALSGGCALAALLLLPPLLGFALFFCLVHSPMQFRVHADALGLRGFKDWGRIVVPLSLGGLSIAAAVFFLHDSPSPTTSLFASSFMTLSILTVPHMLVPFFMRRASCRNDPLVA